MTRDLAIQLDARLIGAVGVFDAIRYYLSNNVSADEYAALSAPLFAAMARTDEMARQLHASFPDIMPRELNSNPRVLR